MADYLIKDTTLKSIADAIRSKTGSQSSMKPSQMVDAIQSIQTGGGGSEIPTDLTAEPQYVVSGKTFIGKNGTEQTGTLIITTPENYDGQITIA